VIRGHGPRITDPMAFSAPTMVALACSSPAASRRLLSTSGKQSKYSQRLRVPLDFRTRLIVPCSIVLINVRNRSPFNGMSNYEAITRDHLRAAFADGAEALAARLPARRDGDGISFRAFGEVCRITPESVMLDGRAETGPRGLVVSLYAANALADPMHMDPWTAFRDFSGSMPYQGAFAANSERPLVPHALAVQSHHQRIRRVLGLNTAPPEDLPGDVALRLLPLPKIALCYIVHLPDEEFPASVTCLFSNNARAFMPLDGLADTAEYTTRKILDLITEA